MNIIWFFVLSCISEIDILTKTNFFLLNENTLIDLLIKNVENKNILIISINTIIQEHIHPLYMSSQAIILLSRTAVCGVKIRTLSGLPGLSLCHPV